jgi:hypothetical protein
MRLLVLVLLLLARVLNTMATAAASGHTTEGDEAAAKKVFVDVGAHEVSPWTWHVGMGELKPLKWEYDKRSGWRVRVRWWEHASWPHNADRAVRKGQPAMKQFTFETEEQALASMYSTVMAWAVERWGDQLTDQQQRDRRGAAREQQRTTRQQAAQGAVQRKANEERKAQVAAAAAAKRKAALVDAAHRRASGKAKRWRQARGLIAAARIDDARTYIESAGANVTRLQQAYNALVEVEREIDFADDGDDDDAIPPPLGKLRHQRLRAAAAADTSANAQQAAGGGGDGGGGGGGCGGHDDGESADESDDNEVSNGKTDNTGDDDGEPDGTSEDASGGSDDDDSDSEQQRPARVTRAASQDDSDSSSDGGDDSSTDSEPFAVDSTVMVAAEREAWRMQFAIMSVTARALLCSYLLITCCELLISR